jgi:acetate kinase
MQQNILTINSGSSSIKFSVYRGGADPKRLLSGRLERIGLGLDNGKFFAFDAEGGPLSTADIPLADHEAALNVLFSWLAARPEGRAINVAAHRVVHGGPHYTTPRMVGEELLQALKRLCPFAAEHLPHEIKAIEAISAAFPGLPQAACFDTSFHRTMPDVATTFAIPAEFRTEGVIRYGFHGLSYEYIMEELSRIDTARSNGRVIIAHLGNGCSMCAVKGGRSVDTTMGFTPLGGLVMSTRTGDLDPGIIVYLLKTRGYNPDELNELLNRRSGLLGISGISPDMTDLLKKEATGPSAALAIEVFCYQARKSIGALASVLGGLDTLVFTAGMGENSPEIRERIVEGLGFLGLEIDREKNMENGPVISKGPVQIRVMKTNEELMLARDAWRLLSSKA